MCRKSLLLTVMVLLVVSPAQANPLPVTLTLNSVGPTGTVVLSGSPVPGGSADVYAGLLDWTDSGGNLVQTYCIDVQAFIYLNHSYSFFQESLPTATVYNTSTPLFSTPVVNAIENLFNDHPDAANPATADNASASAFQVALWDVIYNYNGNTGPYGGADAPGLLPTSSEILGFSGLSPSPQYYTLPDAVNWAAQAYTDGLYSPSQSTDVTALVATDGSQNQAIYIVPTNNDSVAPLPSPVVAGLALLGLIPIVRRRQQM